MARDGVEGAFRALCSVEYPAEFSALECDVVAVIAQAEVAVHSGSGPSSTKRVYAIVPI